MEIIFFIGYLGLFFIFAHSVFNFIKRIEIRQIEQNKYITEFAKSLNKNAPSAEQIEFKVKKKTEPKKVVKGWSYSPSKDMETALMGNIVDPFD